MQTWIALFRGIHVRGKNILPMAELRSDLEELGLHNVRTCIQSGNVVFESTAMSTPSLGKKIDRRIEEGYGFRPEILLLSHKDLQAAIASNPFPRATSEPKTLHFAFLAEPASHPDMEELDQIKASTGSFQLTERVSDLHAPDGVGRSKLAATPERLNPCWMGVVRNGAHLVLSSFEGTVPRARETCRSMSRMPPPSFASSRTQEFPVQTKPGINPMVIWNPTS